MTTGASVTSRRTCFLRAISAHETESPVSSALKSSTSRAWKWLTLSALKRFLRIPRHFSMSCETAPPEKVQAFLKVLSVGIPAQLFRTSNVHGSHKGSAPAFHFSTSSSALASSRSSPIETPQSARLIISTFIYWSPHTAHIQLLGSTSAPVSTRAVCALVVPAAKELGTTLEVNVVPEVRPNPFTACAMAK